MKLPILLMAVIAMAAGQPTQVDLHAQSKDVDFSNASLTKPARVGSVLPAVCSVGEAFFNTSATAGLNLYICTSTNLWQAPRGSGIRRRGIGDVDSNNHRHCASGNV